MSISAAQCKANPEEAAHYIKSQDEEIERLRAALKPFAAFADALSETTPDEIALGIYAGGSICFGPSGGGSVGDLRKARAALGDQQTGDSNVKD